MQDAPPGRHPLSGAIGNEPATPVGVLVGEGPVDHVSHGLKASVGMPRCPLRLAGGVVDFTHLVHVDERVKLLEGPTGKGVSNREPFPLEAARRTRYRRHAPFGR